MLLSGVAQSVRSRSNRTVVQEKHLGSSGARRPRTHRRPRTVLDQAQIRGRRRPGCWLRQGGAPLLVAERWDNVQDLTGWWLSEKLDGVPAYWDGTALVSRLGRPLHAPESFSPACPAFPWTVSCGSIAKHFSARSASSAARQVRPLETGSIHRVRRTRRRCGVRGSSRRPPLAHRARTGRYI